MENSATDLPRSGCKLIRVKALQYWKAVAMDRSNFLERLLAVLEEAVIEFCVIGGAAVNAYAEPVITLDLDIAVSVRDLPRAEEALTNHFEVRRFPHSLNLSDPGSNLRLQISTDPRYEPFVARA